MARTKDLVVMVCVGVAVLCGIGVFLWVTATEEVPVGSVQTFTPAPVYGTYGVEGYHQSVDTRTREAFIEKVRAGYVPPPPPEPEPYVPPVYYYEHSVDTLPVEETPQPASTPTPDTYYGNVSF